MILRRRRQLEQDLADLTNKYEDLCALVDSLHERVLPFDALQLPAHAQIGENSRVDASTLIHSATPDGTVVIGDNVKVYRGGEIMGPSSIGSGTFINRDVYIRANTTIGCNVNIGPFVKFVTDTHAISNRVKRAGSTRWNPIVVGDGAWIGAGAIIVGGVAIGAASIVAAGAVVTKDVPPNVIVAGVPAKVVRELDPLVDAVARTQTA